jgi:thioredoxin reductase (NADPH)
VAATQIETYRLDDRFPDLADEEIYPRLSDKKLEWLGKRGARKSFEPGEVLYEHAVRDAPFYIIEKGLVEFVDRKPGKDVYVAQADSGTFIGDIAIFTGEPTISACVAVDPTDVIVFDRQKLRKMVARWPEFGEHIFRTLLARRAWHESEGYGVMRLIAPRGSRRAFEVRDLLERNLLPVRWYDVDTDEESAKMLDWLQIPREETPVLVHARNVLRNPSPAQVARQLGLRAEVDGQRFDLVTLGAGPAGLAAAVYGGSEGLSTFVAEAWAPGGQAGTSTRIENYLGFETGISGVDLTRKATLQARSCRASTARSSSPTGRRGVSASTSTMGSTCSHGRSSWRRAPAGVSFRPTASSGSAARASTTPRCRRTPSGPEARTWSSSAAGTPPGRPRCTCRPMRGAFGSSSEAPRSSRRCRSTSSTGSRGPRRSK